MKEFSLVDTHGQNHQEQVSNKKHIIWIVIALVASQIADISWPEGWDKEVDRYHTLLSSKIWYISIYLVLTLILDLASKLTGQLFFKVACLFSAGKLIDQFWNPYGYHISEMGWDIIILFWTVWQIRKRKCTNGTIT